MPLALLWAGWMGIEPSSSEDRARLPGSLVYLKEVDPTILQDMKYATADNFTGRIVSGYSANECILVRQAAEALAKVQADLQSLGMALKVYDCFRPLRAVRDFMVWAHRKPDSTGARRFHPNTSRDRLVSSGYIARTSAHSRGVAVDLTLVQIGSPAIAPFDPKSSYGACTEEQSKRAPDNSIDMGTGFDCFDRKSHVNYAPLLGEQAKARKLLVTAMTTRGFESYSREWWHFTFKAARFGPPFDLEIEPHQNKAR